MTRGPCVSWRWRRPSGRRRRADRRGASRVSAGGSRRGGGSRAPHAKKIEARLLPHARAAAVLARVAERAADARGALVAESAWGPCWAAFARAIGWAGVCILPVPRAVLAHAVAAVAVRGTGPAALQRIAHAVSARAAVLGTGRVVLARVARAVAAVAVLWADPHVFVEVADAIAAVTVGRARRGPLAVVAHSVAAVAAVTGACHGRLVTGAEGIAAASWAVGWATDSGLPPVARAIAARRAGRCSFVRAAAERHDAHTKPEHPEFPQPHAASVPGGRLTGIIRTAEERLANAVARAPPTRQRRSSMCLFGTCVSMLHGARSCRR